MVVEGVLAHDLDESGHGHRENGENKAYTHTLELGDAGRVAGEAADEGDEGELIDRDEDGHEN